MESEDACYEFKQEQDLTHRTHLYYLDYDFLGVSLVYFLFLWPL